MAPKKQQGKTDATKKKKLTNTNKGAKKTTKKWSKGKIHDALNNAVLFDKPTLDKLNTEVPKWKLITPSIVSDRLKIAVSLASNGLNYLAQKKVIKLVSKSSKFKVYTRALVDEPAAAAPTAVAATTTAAAPDAETKEKPAKGEKKTKAEKAAA